MAKAFVLILAVLLVLSMACVQQNQPPQTGADNNSQGAINPATPANESNASFVHLNTVSALRVKNLARGVNVANWFWYPESGDNRHFGDYFTDAEFEWLQTRGFTFIRLPIDPKWLYVEGEPGTPNATTLAYINSAVERALDHNLSIVLELHENDWQKLETNSTYDDNMVALWGALARNWSKYDADRVFFEPINEPRYYVHPQDWFVLQKRLLAEIRANAPEHTIFATGPVMSSVEGLTLMRPVEDGNIIYTFHFYDPAAFTHQGATWLPGGFDQIRNLRYPYELQNAREVLANISDPVARAAVVQYAADEWNASVVKKKIGSAAAWAQKNNVTILAGEFGANEVFTPAVSRIAWMTDARQTFDENNVGWAVWSYEAGFGIGAHVWMDGKVSADEASMTALGLGNGCVDCSARKYN